MHRNTAVCAPLRVLIVDDEPNIVEFLACILMDAGFDVRTARDGQEAITAIACERPHVVVTDLMMPRVTGWELCDYLRADVSLRTLPVIVMSAVDTRGVPADACLQKPFETDELLTVLDNLLRRPDTMQVDVLHLRAAPSRIARASAVV